MPDLNTLHFWSKIIVGKSANSFLIRVDIEKIQKYEKLSKNFDFFRSNLDRKLAKRNRKQIISFYIPIY